MPEKVMPGPVEDLSGIREAVCIHTRKIYDSCREEDITPLRLSPPQEEPSAVGYHDFRLTLPQCGSIIVAISPKQRRLFLCQRNRK